MSILKSVFVIMGILVIAGCASIIHGSRQNISVASQPSGAVVKVNNITTTTPGVINLHRSTPMYILRFEKEGYEPMELKLIRTKDGWIWGNILVGGLIGLCIDFSNGAAYKLTPNEVNVALESLGYSEKDTKQDKVVILDTQETNTTMEYYKTLYTIISKSIVKPLESGAGIINVDITLLADGAIQDIKILDNSAENIALQKTVVRAIKKVAPFPPFPDEMKNEPSKVFTISIEFK